ncbi:hypothetical protein BGZ94_006513 [Podila epigama]|nr:hypothetical protein BGZ94_006513 [Podila epigama]
MSQDLSKDEDDTETNASSAATATAKAAHPSKKPFQYKEIILLETDFRERFVKGGGNGGQKINKTNSNVELKHYETGIVVQCQATRSLPQNRKLARRILVDRLDEYYNGEMSKRGQKAAKIREKKRRAARKSSKKYQHHDNEQDEESFAGKDEDGLDDKDHGSEHDQDGTFGVSAPSLNSIRYTTLEEVLASDTRKASRRKTKQ